MATAQSSKQKKADKLYNDLAYIEAVDVYKELIEKDYNTVYNQSKLGDSYLKLTARKMQYIIMLKLLKIQAFLLNIILNMHRL